MVYTYAAQGVISFDIEADTAEEAKERADSIGYRLRAGMDPRELMDLHSFYVMADEGKDIELTDEYDPGQCA